jgi:hypothetical protein
MQQRPWHKGLAHVGGAFLLLAVPAVALLCFSPSAVSAFATSAPQALSVSAAPAHVAPAPADSNVADTWSDTSLQLTLVQQARRQSLSLNNALRATRKQIMNLNPKDANYSFNYALLQQTLLLLAAERDAWDGTWRKIGVPGANQAVVQNQLITLNVLFVSANSALAVAQSQSVTTGTVVSFNPNAQGF